jgi:predicted nuclease of predicted toxin-antitoxin system
LKHELEATAVRDLGLRNARDWEIFEAARAAQAVVMSKDADFAELVRRRGAPPQVLWVTCGNATNAGLERFLSQTLPTGLALIRRGEPLVRLAEVPHDRSDR